MALIIGKIKCYFCNKEDGVMQSLCEYGIYGAIGKRLFYHTECLHLIEVNPTCFPHIMMDKALHVYDLRKQNIKNFNDLIKVEFDKKIEQLQKNHFETMMPSKE